MDELGQQRQLRLTAEERRSRTGVGHVPSGWICGGRGWFGTCVGLTTYRSEGSQEFLKFRRGQTEGCSEQARRFQMRCRALAAFEIANRADAHAGRLRERFLAQAGANAIGAHEFA